MSRLLPCIPIFRRFFSIKSVKTMCLCDGIKNHIVTCEKCMFWSKKGNKRIYDAGWPKNILLDRFVQYL